MAASLRRSLASLRGVVGANIKTAYRFRNSGARMELGVIWCRNFAASFSSIAPWSRPDSRNKKDNIHKPHVFQATNPPEYKKSRDGEDLNDDEPLEKRIGKCISSVEKRKFLVNTLLDLKDSKEDVYSTLDAWVAWEQNFPLTSLRMALVVLEKHEQWHRIVQVIKWMLSKGQGTTMGTYEQLIRALEKDNRAEEAHRFWMKKINHDLHSVPWRFCGLMISIYHRNNMLERLLKLFQGLEAFDRKPPSTWIVQKVGDAYEVLGLLEEKNKLMEKYKDLFSEPSNKSRKWKRSSAKNGSRAEKETCKDTKA